MNKFAMMVKEVASPDLGRMGMELLSFTIKDVRTIQSDSLHAIPLHIIYTGKNPKNKEKYRK